MTLPTLAFWHYTRSPTSSNNIEGKIKGIQFEKEDIKLFSEYTIIYVKIEKTWQKILIELIVDNRLQNTKFKYKSQLLFYTNNEQMEFEIKNTLSIKQ